MEPISLLLDTFISLCEKIINLQKTKRENKQQVFKEIIEPLYVQLQPIAEDYKVIFRRARQLVIETPDNADLYPDLYSEDPDLLESLIDPDRLYALRQERAKKYWKAFDEIREMREKNELARISVLTMAEQVMAMFNDKDIHRFALYLCGFFHNSLNIKQRSTISTEFLVACQEALDEGLDKNFLIMYIDEVLDSIGKNWSRIGQSYSELKINSLSAPNLIKK